MHLEGRIRSGDDLLDGDLRDVGIATGPGGIFLYATTGQNGGISVYKLYQDGRLASLSGTAYFNVWGIGVGRFDTVSLDGSQRLILSGVGLGELIHYDIGAGAGLATSGNTDLPGGSTQSHSDLAVAALTGGRTGLYTVGADTGALGGWFSDGTGHLQATVDLNGEAADFILTGTAVLDVAQVGTSQFLLAADSGTQGVRSYEIAPETGALTAISSVGATDGLGVALPTALGTVNAHGAAWVVLAAADSNSLSVMRLADTGELVPTDHILDTRATRFAGVTALEMVEVDGHVFVFAGGADDGLSLFMLLPGGYLAHKQTLIHDIGQGLENVTDITAARIGSEIQIFVASGNDAGLSQFSLSLEDLGFVIGPQDGQITDRDGDDILISDAGGGVLTGGAGADLFVLNPTSEQITITDFQAGIDQLDLTRFPMLRSVAQLVLTPTGTGIRITYGATTVDVISWDETPLTTADIWPNGFLTPDRIAFLQPPPVETLIYGTMSGDVLVGAGGIDRILAMAGDDQVWAGDGDDLVYGGGGDDWLIGQDGDDQLTGDVGADRLEGGFGADQLFGGGGDDLLSGGAGTDQLIGQDGDDHLSGDDGADRLEGWAGLDQLYGGGGNDQLFGGGGDDLLIGGDGDDHLTGDDGVDQLEGGAGADQLSGGSGDDQLSGGSGDDLLIGQGGNDHLAGDDGADRLEGWVGADQLFGGDGNDRLYGGTGADQLFGQDGDDQLNGDGGADRLEGGLGADQLFGGDDDDVLSGGAGDDRVIGQDGDDHLSGDAGADRLEGWTGADQLYGGDGNDVLFGGHGEDEISGGQGADLMFGGPDADLFLFSSDHGVDVISDFVPGEDRIQIDIEGLVHADLDLRLQGADTWFYTRGGSILLRELTPDELTVDDLLLLPPPIEALMHGTMSGDALLGGSGADRILAMAGNDRVWAGDGNDRVYGGGGDDRLIGEDGNDRLIGDIGADLLEGGAGADQLFGGVGDDRVSGGTGSDLLIGQGGDDHLAGDAGADRLEGWAGDDQLFGGEDNDRIYGGAGDDHLFGQDGDDRLAGDLGEDWLEGGAGVDLMFGGDDDDVLSGGLGDDRVIGQDGDDHLSGDAGADRVEGWTGADQLFGGQGDDLLFGGRGEDEISGGDGDDLMFGGPDADLFLFSSGHGVDVISDFVPGEDRMQIDIEGLVHADLDIRLQGEDTWFYTQGGSILLRELTPDELTVDDFLFL